MNSKDLKRFFSYVQPVTESGCWLWVGGLRSLRYGCFYLEGSYVGSHRAAYEHFKGPIPEGMCVCHKCDVTTCVNPDHLFLGTHGDNMQDMWDKKRKNNSGEKNGRAKLTYEIADEIRERWKQGEQNLSALGRDYGVTHVQIRKIVDNKAWVKEQL